VREIRMLGAEGGEGQPFPAPISQEKTLDLAFIFLFLILCANIELTVNLPLVRISTGITDDFA
jgi:hypothetical protein